MAAGRRSRRKQRDGSVLKQEWPWERRRGEGGRRGGGGADSAERVEFGQEGREGEGREEQEGGEQTLSLSHSGLAEGVISVFPPLSRKAKNGNNLEAFYTAGIEGRKM